MAKKKKPPLGETLRAIRTAREMTQEDIESATRKRFGKDNVVTQGTISQIENGNRVDPYVSTIEKICAILDVSVSDLLEGNVPNG